MLSERLKALEIDGYLSRKMYPVVLICVEYKLTDFGHSYLVELLELAEWSDKHSNTIIQNRKKFLNK